MNLEIGYSKKANKFLEKNSKTITEKEVDTLIISAIKKIPSRSHALAWERDRYQQKWKIQNYLY
jgi:mRNA-degrading endonuclease RelE of RelBE toxin-antitoxin system